jgi:hypothetical protein
VLPPTRATMASWALNKFGPVRTRSWVTFPFEFVKVEDFPKKNVKIEDAAERWDPDVSLLNNKRVLSEFIFFPVIAGYLAFILI